jgi:hypothetical protein
MFDIFDISVWDDVPSDLKTDPDFVYFGQDSFAQIESEEETRKSLQAGAILRGYSYDQVKKASDDRLKVMNDTKTCRRDRVTP